MKKQQLPEGLTHEKIKEIIDYYENQSEEEAEAEIEAAFADPRSCMMQVPLELVEDVRNLIAQKASRPLKARSGALKVAEVRKRYGK